MLHEAGALTSVKRWAARNYGEENFRLDDSFKPLIAELAKDITIKTDWQVREINFEDVGSIKITNQAGEVCCFYGKSRSSRIVRIA